MDKIVNIFLWAGDKFMPEIHLRQPRFKKVLVDHLIKTKKYYKNFKKSEIKDIFKKKLDKTCFQHDKKNLG